MGEWQETQLSNLIELIGGGTPKTREAAYWHGHIPWLSVADFNTGRKYVHKAEKHITDLGLEKSSTNLLNKGDVIISARGTVGVVSMLGRPMTFNQSCYGVRGAEGVSNEYVYYLLKYAVEGLQQISHGGVFDTITRDTFREIDVLYPETPSEQRAIAEVLSSLDEKIDLLDRQNKTLEAMAEALFRHTFIDNAQDDWETVVLGDLVETNVSNVNSEYQFENILYLDTGSITKGTIEGYQALKRANAPSRAKRLVAHNDILISTVRPNQEHYGIIKNPSENLVVSTGFCVLKATGIDPHLLYIYLTTDEMTEKLHVIAEASTSAYPSLKPSDIEALELTMPTGAVLDEISSIAKANWDKIEQNNNEIETLAALRDTLLPKLMSGEIRVAYEEGAA